MPPPASPRGRRGSRVIVAAPRGTAIPAEGSASRPSGDTAPELPEGERAPTAPHGERERVPGKIQERKHPQHPPVSRNRLQIPVQVRVCLSNLSPCTSLKADPEHSDVGEAEGTGEATQGQTSVCPAGTSPAVDVCEDKD